MNRIIFVALLTLMELSNICSQDLSHWNYKRDFNQANVKYNDGDHAAALGEYTELFSVYDTGLLTDVYNTLTKAIKHEDCNLVQLLIETAVRRGASLNDFMQYAVKENRNKVCAIYDLVDTVKLLQLESELSASRDSFLINELKIMAARDQEFRDDYPYDFPEGYDKFIDSLNYWKLKRIISHEGGKLPAYEKLGPDAYSDLKLVMSHLNIEMISGLFPAIVRSINANEFYNGESVLYQIDRNIIGSFDIYRYDAGTGRLKSFRKNEIVHPELGAYQYYRTIEYYDPVANRPMFYPIHKEVDDAIVKELYEILQVIPVTEDWRLRQFETVNDEEFIKTIFGR